MITNICVITADIIGLQESSISGNMIIDSAITEHFTRKLKKAMSKISDANVSSLPDFNPELAPDVNTIYVFPENVYHTLPATFLSNAKYVKFPNSQIFSSNLEELAHIVKLKASMY